MDKTAYKLADYMISGFFFYGNYKLKRNLTIVHFIIFPLVAYLVFAQLLPMTLRFILFFAFLFGIVITICQLVWISHAANVSYTVRKLQKRGDCRDALQEIEKTGKPYFTKRDVFFGLNYAFFFSAGAVFAYSDITSLHIESNYDRIKPLGSVTKNKNVLWGRLHGGKWLPLAHTSATPRNETSLKPLKDYAAKLMEQNPEIQWG